MRREKSGGHMGVWPLMVEIKNKLNIILWNDNILYKTIKSELKERIYASHKNVMLISILVQMFLYANGLKYCLASEL